MDWSNSWYLEAEPGDYITVARQAKGKQEWYVGAITDEHPRTATIPFSFLPEGNILLPFMQMVGMQTGKIIRRAMTSVVA